MNATSSAAAALPSDIVQSPLPRLKITEIFTSLQGEADAAGWPSVFVRLTGCPLRCTYCDTAYAFHGGTWWDIDDIVAEVLAQGVQHVCVTGGEPLAQKRCLILLEKLCDAGLDVSLEASGALDVSGVDPRVSRVVDLKTPDSGEMARNLLENLPLLTRRDQIKFVLCSREDYDASWPTGSSPTGCRCASRCSCTRFSGTTSQGVEPVRGPLKYPGAGQRAGPHNPPDVFHEERSRASFRRHGFRRRHRHRP